MNNAKNTWNKEWDEIAFKEGSVDHLISASSRERTKKVITGSLLIKKMIGSDGSICQKSMKQNIFQINFLNVLCPQITAKETTVKVKYLRNIFLSFHTRLQGIGKLSKFMDWTFVKMRECYPCNLWEEISFPWIQIFRFLIYW